MNENYLTSPSVWSRGIKIHCGKCVE